MGLPFRVKRFLEKMLALKKCFGAKFNNTTRVFYSNKLSKVTICNSSFSLNFFAKNALKMQGIQTDSVHSIINITIVRSESCAKRAPHFILANEYLCFGLVQTNTTTTTTDITIIVVISSRS